jgi:hypothetical protein
MADNFDMKKFLVENKLGAYSRLKEETINESEITYEYGSDGGCYRVDDEGNYDEVDDSMCKKYAGQGVREEKEEVEEAQKSNEIEWVSSDFSPIEGIKVKKGDKGEIVNHDTGDQYLVKFNKHRFYANVKDFKELKEDIGGDIGDAEAAKQMDFLAEKDKVKEALSPEAFERMDALTSHSAQIAMIKAAEIMMEELTDYGFQVLDIRKYFTQLIANDI